MNWWPWVSRRAFDLVVKQCDRLEAQNDSLLEHVKRMDRIEHGVGELQPEAKPKEPLSDEIIHEIRRWARVDTREELTRQALTLRAQGKTDEEILDALRGET